ncbi:HK97 family phage prohead protease [Paracoccus zhejiangensis]|uniref:HK97 family phage prohead protease n=1 Tax=Paracoccus zhejiangensis TaxID=1077935 RepID=UPI001E49BCBA|nr:HK97 family phage prohead protease [Paracoccus zhejiangensis]
MTDPITLLTRRADLAPASADRDARTVEVIWSTGAPVRRRDMAGAYAERLSLAPEAVDLSRLQGASVLDAHRQSAVRDVLGSVQSASVDGQHGTALIRFSARPEVEPLWQDVLSGILRHVSVGYSVEQWAETTENGARVLTAVRWTPHEISLVPTPADPGAHIRMETNMPDTITPAPPEAQTRATINTEIRSIARIAGLDQSWIDGQIDAAADAEARRRSAPNRSASRWAKARTSPPCAHARCAKPSMHASIRSTNSPNRPAAMPMPRRWIWPRNC